MLQFRPASNLRGASFVAETSCPPDRGLILYDRLVVGVGGATLPTISALDEEEKSLDHHINSINDRITALIDQRREIVCQLQVSLVHAWLAHDMGRPRPE